MRKDRSPCREEELTVGEFVSPLYETLDNGAPDTNCTVETEPNISYQTVIHAARKVKKANTTSRIAEKCDKEDVSCKRFICILITITLVTLISLICLAVLFIDVSKISQTPSSQNESVFMSQLEQINKSLTSIQDQITTLSREEMENNAAQSNNIQQLNTSIDMQLTTLHNQIQQLSDSNTMLQQQLTTLHTKTQQLCDSNTMLQQQLTTLHNQTQQLSDSNTMLQQQLGTALLPGQLSIYPAASCAALPPSSPSGYYRVSNSNDSSTLVYCTMSCGTLTGGWTRVAFLDMTNSSHQCPSGLMERNDSPNIRTCVRNEVSAGCTFLSRTVHS